MTLATRCPSCGTVFRVVQDQLRVSEGWVRCGRCNGVFDATEVLFDIDSGVPVQLQAPPGDEAPPAPPPPAPAPAAPRPEPPTGHEFGPAPAWTAAGPVEPAFAEGRLPEPVPEHPHREEPLLRAPSRSSEDEADDDPIVISDHPVSALPAGHRSTPPRDVADTAAVPAMPAMPAVPAAASAPPATAQVQAAPSFMREAERAALWRRPAMRAGLWLGVLGLAVLALAQTALLWRDALAAYWPAAAPPLQALCRVAGCSVQPLRRIESLSVDSSGLNRLEGSSLYRLQLVLRNRADTAVMMPALDLTLSNAQGQLVSRRVLAAAELGFTQPSLSAGQELPIKVLVSTGERRVDGYTLELFYP